MSETLVPLSAEAAVESFVISSSSSLGLPTLSLEVTFSSEVVVVVLAEILFVAVFNASLFDSSTFY